MELLKNKSMTVESLCARNAEPLVQSVMNSRLTKERDYKSKEQT